MKFLARLFIVTGVLLIPVVIGAAIDRALFSFKSIAADGIVSQVTATNDSCGKKRNYSCTRFLASIAYAYHDRRLQRSAGIAEGHDQPPSLANYAAGSTVPIVFNPDQPDEVYLDSFFEVWGDPLLYLLCPVAFLFAGLMARLETISRETTRRQTT